MKFLWKKNKLSISVITNQLTYAHFDWKFIFRVKFGTSEHIFIFWFSKMFQIPGSTTVLIWNTIFVYMYVPYVLTVEKFLKNILLLLAFFCAVFPFVALCELKDFSWGTFVNFRLTLRCLEPFSISDRNFINREKNKGLPNSAFQTGWWFGFL